VLYTERVFLGGYGYRGIDLWSGTGFFSCTNKTRENAVDRMMYSKKIYL
jgi:hypothetical protein